MLSKKYLRLTACGWALSAVLLISVSGHAEEIPTDGPAVNVHNPEASESADADNTNGAGDDFDPATMLTGDWGGFRTKLYNHGINFGATEIAEVLGNPTGGTSRGAVFEGRLELDAALDFDKMFGWHGWSLFANAYQIHGRGISASDLGNNIMTVSNIEANRSTRLFDLWVQKEFDDGFYSLRLGQLAADDEFIVSDNEALYVNSVFGWPGSVATDIPSGGAAFPLATPGARFRIGTNEGLSFATAIFDGDPGGAGTDPNPQTHNSSGTVFNLDRGAFLIDELAYGVNRGKDDTGLPATYKVGFWYQTENFADLHDDNAGGSLASSTTSGVAKMHHGDCGLYGVVDQTVWIDAANKDRSVALFGRAMFQPSDRNVDAWQVDGGVNMKGLFDGRPQDVLGLSFAYIGISQSAINFDRESNQVNGTDNPVRDSETLFEATYQAPVTSWLTVQPDFQYIIHPGGNVADPNSPTNARIKDAAVFGLRAVVKF